MGEYSNNYLVVFMPEGQQTIDHLKMVTAFSSTAALEDISVEEMVREDRDGRFSECGAGTFTIYQSGDNYHVFPWEVKNVEIQEA